MSPPRPGPGSEPPVKVAILSLLFNWPSTAGGAAHTFELARSLAEAGYDVRHVYARHDGWGLGQVEGPLGGPICHRDVALPTGS
jgi:hypothetical protein